jgi:hypothetical protein
MNSWKHFYGNVRSLIIVVTLLFMSCQSHIMKNKTIMEYKPQTFTSVPINSMEQNICSPSNPGPEWRGILINAPEEIGFALGETRIILPICGYYHLDMESLLESQPLKFNVSKKGEDHFFSGFLLDKDPSPQEPEPFSTEVRKEDLKDLSLGSYFNPNLIDYVNVPLITGEYQVFVEYGGIKSNTVIVKVTIK